ncbi:MAG TPA: hypothetical protein PLQ86_11965, partial [Candidatus Aminicenantes bacterium]|nr:hypothetical protein [Candidatus Aminicenantes bacterium]
MTKVREKSGYVPEVVSKEKIRQKAKTLEEAYADAEKAYPELLELSNYLADKYGGRVEERPLFDDSGNPIAYAPAEGIRLKSKESTERKLKDEYGGDIGKITDLGATSVVFEDYPTMLRALGETLRLYSGKVWYRNGFENVIPEGSRDISLRLEMENGHWMELQIHLEALYNKKAIKIQRPEPEIKSDPVILEGGVKAQQGVIPGAGMAETFGLTASPGEIGTSRTPAPDQGGLFMAPEAGFRRGPARVQIEHNIIYDNGKIYYTYDTPANVKAKARDFVFRKMHEGQEIFYRKTNNRNEHKLKDIVSINHASGEREKGMSVSQHPYYPGYKYTGVVTGDIVGFGSDGEPVIKNVKWLHKPVEYEKLPAKYKIENIRKKPPISFDDVTNAELVYGLPDDAQAITPRASGKEGEVRYERSKKLSAPGGADRPEGDSLPMAPEPGFRRTPEPTGAVPDKPIGRSEIRQFLEEKLSIPIRTGRFVGRALGIFKPRSEVIRTRLANDIEVIAHEVGHALHKFLWPETITKKGLSAQPFQAFAHELDRIATTPKKGQSNTAEGWAEFVRLYITDPAQAQRRAPDFFRFFEGQLDLKAPEVKEIFLEAREKYRQFMDQPPLWRILSQISIGK